MEERVIKGPSVWRLMRDLGRIRKEPLEYLLEAHAEYGEVISVWLGVPALLLNGPADIRHVLVDNPENYLKTGGLVAGRMFFGEGLLTSEGSVHARMRRLILPMMHKARIARYAAMMAEAAGAEADTWRDGERVDVAGSMTRLALNVIGRTLLGVDLSKETAEISAGVTAMLEYLMHVVSRPIRLPGVWFNRRYRLYRDATARIDALVVRLIAARRHAPGDDILSMLLEATDEEGTPLTDREVRDELMTLFAAGHETTANALVWAWHLLGTNPDARGKFHEEIDAMPPLQPGSAPDPRTLPYTAKVFSEALRLYPPVWQISRAAAGDDLLPSGARVSAGMQILLFPWTAHRNPAHFPEPDLFRPERFNGDDRSGEFVYFPFSAGQRGCIGEQFARMEAVILLAVIGSKFALDPDPHSPPARPEPLLTLRPARGFSMIARKRT